MYVSHFIGGEAYAGKTARSGPVFNPSTGEKSYDLSYADRALVDHAVQVAARAGKLWGDTSQARRLGVMFRMRELLIANTDKLAELVGVENGKTIADAKGEIGRALEAIEYATSAAEVTKGEYSRNVGGGIDVFSIREPVGVVACIAPFNFPVMVPMMMACMALAVGNAVIVKPSEKVPAATFMLGQLWKEAGLPDGVWNAVNGDKEVVDALLEHPLVPVISFVGSTPVGEYIYQRGSSFNKRVAAYTGGKNHMIVMPDADLEEAASAFVSAGYGSASQRCMAISLLLPVGQETADRLIEILIPKIRGLHMGAYNDPKADFGAVVSAESRQQVLAAMHKAVEDGATVLVDRHHEVAGQTGFYVGASLLDHVRPDMDIYRHEVFGPVRGIVRVADLDEAIRITNDHEFGNGAVIYTRSGPAAHRFVAEVKAGMIGVNVAVPVPVGHHNFGGLRRSKFGDAHMFGPDAARFYTDAKTVSQRWAGVEATQTVSMAFPSNG
ncbi:CoA-acylating methylmalonate-semialdehyde dehydrogenase [Sphingobium sp. AN641]|uniref:CoA-acylating methylmalonate-semialdehyde dehydrogenase n=1 Tax=Sphingobium sp. AN641 TaxID=3133443 RepID=UPI0030C59166